MANESVCEDNTTIVSSRDVPIAWFMSGFIVQCGGYYDKQGLCGTFIEIHKPNSPDIVEETKIIKNFETGFYTQYVSTKNLCTGRYEFWIVIRTRNGSTL